MISVASGRNIHFMLVVQSIAQLDEKYNIATRNNILANITYKYYLMSANNETRETITREMEYTEITVQSTSESFAKQNNMLCGFALSQNKTKRKVMSAEELATLPFGNAVIISQRNKPYLTTFANFWDFTQFKPIETINNVKKAIISREQILYNFMQAQNNISSDEKLYLE